MSATIGWRERPRGFCVFELEQTMLAEPSLGPLAQRFGLHGAVEWARSTSRGPGTSDEARKLVQAFAGIPLQTAWKACSDIRFRPGAAEAVVAARVAGLAVVLLATSPRPIAQQLGQRIGIDSVAGWEPEIAYGRFNGRMDGLPWRGGCGEAVCGERLAKDLRGRHGRPAIAISAVPDPCLFQAVDLAIAVGHRHGDAQTVSCLEDVPRLLEEDLHLTHA